MKKGRKEGEMEGGERKRRKEGRMENRLEGRGKKRRKFGITGLKVYGHSWKLNELHIRPRGCQPDHLIHCASQEQKSKRKESHKMGILCSRVYLFVTLLPLHMEKLKL